jgi:hypothetical protein
MVNYGHGVLFMLLCSLVVGACRIDQLHLYPAYKRGELLTDKLRADGFYYRLTPPCGLSDSILSILFIYHDGSCYTANWHPETDLEHFEESLRSSERFARKEGRHRDSGPGWGLYKWVGDTMHVEQFVLFARWRLQAGRWSAFLDDTTLHEVFRPGSVFLLSGKSECVKPFDFHPSDWKPDPSRFFEQNKAFLRSQAYYMKRDRKREARRSRR